ncbi:MAG TPA: hypothetical protein VH915_00945, partial [Pedococcus sp.]
MIRRRPAPAPPHASGDATAADPAGAATPGAGPSTGGPASGAASGAAGGPTGGPATNEPAATSGPAPSAPSAPEDPRAERVAAAVATWQRHLVDLGGRNTLLWYRDLPSGTLDLTTAHPGGVAMLLAGRPTRL